MKFIQNRAVEGLWSRALSVLREAFLDARWTFSFGSSANVFAWLILTRRGPDRLARPRTRAGSVREDVRQTVKPSAHACPFLCP